MKLNSQQNLSAVRPERYQCLGRLLRNNDCQYLREAGFAKLARQKRAADRRAFLKMVHHLATDIRRVADARQQQMERAGTVQLESILKQRLTTEIRIQSLRGAALLHFAHIPAAIQVADSVIASLQQAFAVTTPVLAN